MCSADAVDPLSDILHVDLITRYVCTMECVNRVFEIHLRCKKKYGSSDSLKIPLLANINIYSNARAYFVKESNNKTNFTGPDDVFQIKTLNKKFANIHFVQRNH